VQVYITAGTGQWGPLMAASLITSVPLAVIFVLVQRYFVSGLASGAVKG
jgi:multiple sugar transport system permease protein